MIIGFFHKQVIYQIRAHPKGDCWFRGIQGVGEVIQDQPGAGLKEVLILMRRRMVVMMMMIVTIDHDDDDDHHWFLFPLCVLSRGWWLLEAP